MRVLPNFWLIKWNDCQSFSVYSFWNLLFSFGNYFIETVLIEPDPYLYFYKVLIRNIALWETFITALMKMVNF